MQEPKLTYALRDGKMVSINDVPHGLKCGCVCPKCKQPLEAKKGKVRQNHFAHLGEKAGYKPCHNYYMTALHMLAEQIIEEQKQIMLPAYKVLRPQTLVFEKVEREQRIDRKDLQPDIVGIDADGVRWMIEIRNSHEVDESKRAKIVETGGNCLEIDVRDQSLDLEGLTDFLLKSTEHREWVNAPEMERSFREMKKGLILHIIDGIYDWRTLPPMKNEIRPLFDRIDDLQDRLSNVRMTENGYLTGTGEDGQEYQIFIMAKQFEMENELPKTVKPEIAILKIDVNVDEEENENTSIAWIHFPEIGNLHDRYIEKVIGILRKRIDGLKGKTEESCRNCQYWNIYGCPYRTGSITYKSTLYHLCSRENIIKGEAKYQAEQERLMRLEETDQEVEEDYYRWLLG